MVVGKLYFVIIGTELQTAVINASNAFLLYSASSLLIAKKCIIAGGNN
jgi:hypothetical protein